MPHLLRSFLLAEKALSTGVTGRGSAHLAEFMLERDYEVHGIKCRRAAVKIIVYSITGNEHDGT